MSGLCHCSAACVGLYYVILHYVRLDQIRLDETLIISVTLMISIGTMNHCSKD